jgi:hypothetical protein
VLIYQKRYFQKKKGNEKLGGGFFPFASPEHHRSRKTHILAEIG